VRCGGANLGMPRGPEAVWKVSPTLVGLSAALAAGVGYARTVEEVRAGTGLVNPGASRLG
jgi:hypothetical protein